jgi:uncharacterized protein YbaP (TraB family)
MRPIIAILLAFCSALPVTARAHQAAQPDPAPAVLDTIIVTGEQPGPGLWKVTKGDHVLWVFGTLSPLPRRMQWNAAEVEATLAAADEFIGAPSVSFLSEIGFFGQLALIPSLVSARENPGHVHLDKVLPPELYARWQARKAEYMGRNPKVERWRPIFAAIALYESALKKLGLDADPGIEKRLLKVAKKSGVPVTEAKYTFEIADPKVAINEFKQASLDDKDCFVRTLDRIDDDLGALAAAANAWATGDLEMLRGAPLGKSQWQTCLRALADMASLRSRGITDVAARQEQMWVDVAGAALERNASSFAIVPISLLLAEDGYLQALCHAHGCSIETPDAQSVGAETGAP